MRPFRRTFPLLVLATALVLLSLAGPAFADRTFTPRYTTVDRADFQLVANTLETCPASTACTNVRNGSTTGGNNDFNEINVDADADATTFNSSSSTLAMPAGATVLFAGLYWGADTTAGTSGSAAPTPASNNQVKFRTPAMAGYQTLTAATLDTDSLRTSRYQGFADVTSLVATAGNGAYWTGNVQAGTGNDRYAAWSLIVVYRDPALVQFKKVNVWDGLTSLVSGSRPSVNITLGGFTTPAINPVKGKLALVSYEGDQDLATETATLSGNALSDALNPANNLFNSTVSTNGVNVTTKNPNYVNQTGIDADTLNVDGKIPNAVSSTTLALTTSQDMYIPGAVALINDEDFSAPANTGAPTISGTTQDRQVLTANAGTWTGNPAPTFTYQWRRCDAAGANCSDISGETNATYTLTPTDVGKTIRVVVTGTNAVSGVSATSAQSAVVTALPPSNSTLPSISGTAQDGQALSSSVGVWDGTPTLAYTRQWRRCDAAGANCVDIAGATSASYTATSADVGKTLRVVVTATNPAPGSVSATSAQSSVVAATAPANTALPAITGTLRDGQLLSATSGTWTGTPTISFTYQWRRCDSGGASCADIAGATSATYTATATDVSRTLRVVVTATNAAPGSVSATSAATGQISAAPPVNTVLPVISGTLQDGQTVNASTGTWTGTPTISYAYQWWRCDATGGSCAPVAGATAATYAIGPAEVGGRLRVVVTATNAAPGGGVDAYSLVSAVVGAMPPLNIALPVISGTARDAQTLSVSTGTWTGTAPISFAYQWRRCDALGANCADIAGATSSSYSAVPADVNGTLRAVVTATNGAPGSVSVTAAQSAVVQPAPPANTVLPVISGTARDGQTLSASTGTWTGTPVISFTYQWRRCDLAGLNCSDIAGATATTYTAIPADVGSSLRVVVTAANAAPGTVSATSAASGVVQPAPPVNTVLPVISGTARDGQTLSATTGTWTGTPTISFSHQWRRCDAAGANCADIAGATSSSYTAVPADVNGTLRVVVTAANAAPGTVSATSAASAIVAPAPPLNTVLPVISGTARDGQTLSVSTGTWSGTPTISFAYQWRRCDALGGNCADIAGATSSSYIAVPADVNGTLRAVVTASNAAPGSVSVTAAQSAVVQPAPPVNTALPTISGTARDGQTLTASTGTWTGTPTISFSYQWRRCDAAGANCADIAGATASTYTAIPGDVGSTLRVVVTASNAAPGTVSATSAASGVVQPAPPVNTVLPVISGTARDGQTLSATTGTWTGTPAISFSYQWRRCDAAGANCSNIAGATSSTYTAAAADVNGTVRVVVTASNAAPGSVSATSAASGVVQPAPPLNTVLPVISGTARDGQTLSVSTGTWSGTPTISFAYQWRRCDALGGNCADIAGATSSSYIAVPADVNGTLRAVVTASNAAPGSVSVTAAQSAVVQPAPPVNTALPTISGTARDGQTLTASTGTWTGTPTISFSYQWRRCDAAGANCADIAGATASTYTAVPADVNGTLRVVVTAANTAPGTVSATSAASGVVQPAPPVNTVLPVISGTARDGQTLSATTGTWTGTPTISFSYQWRRCDAAGASCANIAGATSATYAAVPADVNGTLRVVVTAANAAPGSVSATSAASGVVQPAPPLNTVLPVISGTARDGQTLAASTGTWTGTPTISFSYQWRRCDALGANCADIAGATSSSYTAVPADVNGTVRVVVTASNAAPGSVSVTSAATGVVQPAPPVNTVLPVISGTARDGQTLTASTGTWTGTPVISFSYQWRRCDALGANCADIAGATSSTYPATSTDVGKTLRVVVTAANAAPGSVSATSAASGVVQPAPPVNTALPTISGTARDGQTLTASSGTWTGTPTISFAYQWRRCDALGANCADIAGATSSSYAAAPADVNGTLRVVVSASNAAPGSVSATSAASAIVAPAPPLNTVLPVISGTARDGQTLSVSTGTWTGTPVIGFGYQWRRCDALGANCSDIAGATGVTYVATSADVNGTLRVVVTASNAAPGSVSASTTQSAVVQPAPPVNTALPVISGTARDGQTLSASTGTWTGTPTISFAYQWRRCDAAGANCVDVSGATNATYDAASAEVGKTLRVVVTASNAAPGSVSATSAATGVVQPAPPVNTVLPVISGTARDGQTLSASTGTWTGTPTISFAYQWRRCDAAGANCVDISGATNATYDAASAEVGKTLRVVVTASNAAPGSVSATSSATGVVQPTPPVNTALPAISGTARDGQTLSATTGTWTGTPTISFAYQWRRCDAAGANCSDIAGAVGANHVASSADVNGTLRVVVTASNAAPGSVSATSAATGAVQPAPPANTTLPSITGSAIDGGTLTAADGTWTGTPPISFTRQWRRCDAAGANCSDIAGATGTTYQPTNADVGGTLRVVVTASNVVPGSVSATSAATGVVQPAPPVLSTAPSVSGTAIDGHTLTADDGTWGGSGPITFTRRWQRCDALGAGCADIPGATGTTYDLTPADVGQTVRIVVTADNAAPGTVSAPSAVSPIVLATPPVNVTAPSIAGFAQDQATLTGADGTWTGTPIIAFARQWLRCDAAGANCVTIPGATGPTHDLVAGDVGATIRLRVTATNAAPGSVVATSAATGVIAPIGPVNLTLPIVTGGTQQGDVLSTTDGTWAGTPTISFTYQWRRCDPSGSTCATIPGATGPTYTLTAADLGHTVRSVVTATNAAPTPASAASAPTPQVTAAPPVNTTAPSITGTARDGSTLTADDGTWTGTAPITLTRQWQRCDALGAGCVDLPGETGTTYDLTPADVGQTVRVLVTADNPAPGTVSAPSAATAIVLPLAPASVTKPQITGSPVDGSTLTATPGTWTGTPPLTFTHQWQACDAAGANCADIPGEIGPTHVVTAGEVGGTLRVVVTAHNAAAAAPSATSDPVTALPAAPVNTTAPSISGTGQDGSTLTADDGAWSGTPAISTSRQWQRCDAAGANCADISGETGTTYDLTPSDVGHTIRVVVTADNAAPGTVSATSPATGAIAARPPVNTTAPSVSGTERDGSTLTADDGTWSGTPAISTSRQWQRCDAAGANCADISGETGTTYDLTPSDVGHTIRVVVTADNAAPGTVTASSPVTGVIAAAPPVNTGAPSISGTERDGSTLTADDGTWSGTPAISTARQWQRCDAAGTNCANLSGETGTTYDLTPSDVGHTIRVVVTADNAAPGTVTASSPVTGVIAAAPPVNTGAPSITGTEQDGSTLTADDGTWSGTPAISTSRQWQRCDAAGANCADISGQTGTTYDLTPSDVGHTIRIVVTADNAASGTVTASSPATGVIAARPPANTTLPAITGTPASGRTLTATPGSWTGTPPIAHAYQWQQCDAFGAGCLDVPGATGTTLTLGDADVGSTFRVVVTATNGTVPVSATSAATGPVQPAPPSNDSAPWITGVATVGEVFTGHDGTWSGTGPIAFTYRWQRCDADGTNCDDIDSETNQTYTTTVEDIGRTLRIVVTATNAGGSTEQASLVSPVIAGLAPQATTPPSITGTTQDGDTLTGDDGTWTGSQPLQFDRQWQRCDADGSSCTDIPNAGGTTYDLTPQDVGHAIVLKVTVSNTEGPVTAVSAPVGPVTGRAPVNTASPTVNGLTRDTLTLNADDGTWTGTPTITYARQWQRCDSVGANCQDVSGRTGTTYLLGPADVGRTVRVVVTATNVAGSQPAASAVSDVVAASSPLNTRAPAVTGEARQDGVLTADKGDWAGTPQIGFAYRWKRCDADGTSCQDVPGAVSSTLQLGPGDVDYTFRVIVTAFNGAGSAAVVSAPSDVVLPPKPVAVNPPEISGVPGQGAAVVATTGEFAGVGPISYRYQWQRCDATGSACSDIPGATSASYTPGPGDVGATLVVVTTATNKGGSTSQSSKATIPVAAPAGEPVNPAGTGGGDLGTIPGSKVSPQMCQIIENGVGFRRANIPGVGPVRLRLRAEAIVVPESPLRASLTAPAERTRSVSFKLDGKRLPVSGRGEWRASVTPKALATTGRHRLEIITTPTVGKPTRMTEIVTTVRCAMRYTAGMWRTNVGTGVRLRVDSRTSLRRISFRLPRALVSRTALQAASGLGRLRIVLAGGRSVTMSLGGARNADAGVLLAGAGQPKVVVSNGVLRVNGLPAHTGIVEVTLYQPGQRLGRAPAVKLYATVSADRTPQRRLATLLRRATGN